MDELISERLILRKIVREDVTSIFNNWASDPEVTKFLTWPPHDTIEKTNQIMDFWMKEYEDPKTIRYGIVLKESNELIGMIDVVGYVNDNPEIGYCLSRKYWNKGYMSEALDRLLKDLFSIGFKTIVIEADQNNIASNKVIEKCGFTFTHQETKLSSSFKPYLVTVNWYKKDR